MRWCASDLCDWELRTWESRTGEATAFDDESVFDVLLESGVSYQIRVSCGGWISCAVRLELFAPSGRLIDVLAHDGQRRNSSGFNHRANREGLHKIGISITECEPVTESARRHYRDRDLTCDWTVRLARNE